MKTFSLLFTFLFFSITIHSQVFVKYDATGNYDGTSWINAYSNLQDALDNANSGVQIWITAGTYKPMNNALSTDNWFAVNQAVEIYGGFTGTETMLSERDWENNITTLSADILGDDVPDDFENFRSDNAPHIFVINVGGSILDGLIITGGHARIDAVPAGTTDYNPWAGAGVVTYSNIEIRNCNFSQCVAYFGSGICAVSNDLVLDNCIFEKNSGVQAAIYIARMNSSIVKNCIIRDNQSTEFAGGLLLGNTNAIVEDCIFQNNDAPGSVGGGVFIFQNSFNSIPNPSVEFRRCSFLNNNAFYGGGLCFNNFYDGSHLSIDSCDFVQNTNTQVNQGRAGGLLIQNIEDNFGGQLSSLSTEITNSRFEANSALDGGGAYFRSNFDTMNLILQNNEFVDNSATNTGGGFYLENAQSFINATIHNNDFTNNESGFAGGAIAITNDNNNARLIYDIDECTFTGNQSDYCGAIWSTIYDLSDLGNIGTISNSVFIENEGSQCCGAIGSLGEDIVIENTHFERNSTDALDATLPGGGAVFFRLTKNALVQNSTFTDNSSLGQGSALMVQEGDRVRLENVIIDNNAGSSAISNEDSLWLTNVTLVDNEGGILQNDGGYLQLQNTILANSSFNYAELGIVDVVTNGGNLSSDNSLENYLIGFGNFSDFNEISDPFLGLDFVPEQNSLCIDQGNLAGVINSLDRAGLDRIQGNQIDIGAFESPFTVDVEDFEKLGMDVYPNPFIDQVFISDIEGIKTIRLINIEGKVVHVFQVQQELIIQNELPVGMYFLELNYGEKQYYAKLEKQK
jgi:hypothetical protein